MKRNPKAIEEIFIVIGRGKRSIEDHFDSNFELEQNLQMKEKYELLKLVESTTKIRLHFVRQSYPRGLGDAVLHGKSFIGNEPFIVLLGDDLMIDEVPLTKQLMNHYDETQSSVLATMRVPHKDTSKYGIVDLDGEVSRDLYKVNHFVEKQKPGVGNEIQLTDAIETLNKTQQVLAHEFKGKRYDVGDKFGYMMTNIEYGLGHKEVKDDLKKYIIQLSKELDGRD